MPIMSSADFFLILKKDISVIQPVSNCLDGDLAILDFSDA